MFLSLFVVICVAMLGVNAVSLRRSTEHVEPEAIGATLEASVFSATVIRDDHIHVLELYSGMCGFCQEFAPTWRRTTALLTGYKTDRLDVDDEASLDLAIALGLIQYGVPSIHIFSTRGSLEFEPVMRAGEEMTAEAIAARVRDLTEPAAPRGSAGYLLKTM
ncbi:unnamed protein product [Phaeothamnion confervicola]